MEAAATTAPAPAPALRRRLPLARILLVTAALAIVLVAAGYALRLVSASAFQQERAFRVLDEIGAQLDNLQRTLAQQLNLMSDEMAGRDCVIALGAGEDSDKARNCLARREAYARRLALKGPRVSLARVDQSARARACGAVAPGAKQHAFIVRAHRPGAPFTAFSCSAAAVESGVGEHRQLSLIAFTGDMAETIESFVAQGFFDEVLVSLEEGAVTASIGPRASNGVRARSRPMRRLGVTDARSMLERAVAGDAKAEAGKARLPTQPAAYVDTIAGERYRIFVKLLTPAHEIYLDDNGGGDAKRQQRLYLIGLKRDDLRAQIAGAIEPAGRFGLMLLVLLALLGWPLANLRAKAPDDPIAWPEAAACLISIVLIPAVLAVAAVWVWSYQGVRAWADAAAQTYARDVARVLTLELEQGRSVLRRYQAVFDAQGAPAASAPVRVDRTVSSGAEAATLVSAPVRECVGARDRTCTLDARALAQHDAFKAWSPFSSVFATDRDGRRDGARYTVYDAPNVNPDFNYSAREYFRALQQQRGWASDNAGAYVAQRIFSGGDGSRVLQAAVPRRCANGAFCGIITGSLAVHSLSAAISPPLLQFAVIEQRTGQVVFHTDDARSLAEDFFVESENNPRLRALVQIGQSGGFSGYYMGAAHRFYHAPLEAAPWSVVAFYPLRDAGDVSWHAVLTGLAAYCGVMLIILIASALALWIGLRRSSESVRNFAARFWHRLGSPCSYARWGVSLFGGAAVLVAIYEIVVDLRAGQGVDVSPITWWMIVAAAIAAAIIHSRHRRASHSVCIALWLLMVSAAPAAWIALGHHDVQMRGLLRDAMVSASNQVMQRRDAIAGDLRRWLSNGDERANEFPGAWLLAAPSRTMPIAGFAAGDCGLRSAAPDAWTSCVSGPPPLGALITKRDLDFWRRETWSAASMDEAQQRRIELLGATVDSNPSCASTQHTEHCSFRSPDGRMITMGVDLREREAAAVEDEQRFDVVLRIATNIVALAGVVFISWALALFASRRLLGVRSSDHCAVAADAWPVLRSTVFHSRRLQRSAVEELLEAARPHSADGEQKATVTRVNLATDARLAHLIEHGASGPVLLTNLDIALTDAKRRREILGVLERFADDANVQLLIHSRRSPLERLYHPERFPESGPEHALTLDESLRWDNVLQKLDCLEIEEPERPTRHPHLAAVDHHRTWKLCTRAERLLLYQLATGRLANPRNHAVIDALIARGLVALNPWPQIIDPQFAEYVRTAESAADLAQWQRDASAASGRRVRTTLVTITLVLLLAAVLWFNWTASDQFKIVSTILAASVAFLSQIGQAFNFVKSGAGK